MTEPKQPKQKKKKKEKQFFNLHDMLFPKGKVAKLCRFRTMNFSKIKLKEILIKFKLTKPRPVIVISGSKFADKGRFYAGIARAAYKTGAIIFDSGIKTGIEQHCINKCML